ncbi:hypothetical protein LZ32DRAFT_263251 [Colletotrichum eremochloae]|nr:hypothetical protein LZ32DRAFT_263251 [Colletotrichum eremochloae]
MVTNLMNERRMSSNAFFFLFFFSLVSPFSQSYHEIFVIVVVIIIIGAAQSVPGKKIRKGTSGKIKWRRIMSSIHPPRPAMSAPPGEFKSHHGPSYFFQSCVLPFSSLPNFLHLFWAIVRPLASISASASPNMKEPSAP